jgi:predicted DNA repair protein MutK
VHNVPVVHHLVLDLAGKVAPWGWLVEAGANLVVGVIAGAIVLAAVMGIQKMRGKKAAH